MEFDLSISSMLHISTRIDRIPTFIHIYIQDSFDFDLIFKTLIPGFHKSTTLTSLRGVFAGLVEIPAQIGDIQRLFTQSLRLFVLRESLPYISPPI